MSLPGLNIIVCHKTVPCGGCANFRVILTTWGGFLILWMVMFVCFTCWLWQETNEYLTDEHT